LQESYEAISNQYSNIFLNKTINYYFWN